MVVTQNMLRTHEGKKVFSEKKNPICDYSLSNQMPYTDQITKIVPCVRTFFELPSNISSVLQTEEKPG